jgi:Sigma-70, region 4
VGNVDLDAIDRDLDADTITPHAALELCREARDELEMRTCRAVAVLMGISKSRVEQIEDRALRKLRSRWRLDPETGSLYRAISVLPLPGVRRARPLAPPERRSEVGRNAAEARWRPGIAKAEG